MQSKHHTVCSAPFHSLFLIRETIASDTQWLLPTSCSGITPGNAHGTMWYHGLNLDLWCTKHALGPLRHLSSSFHFFLSVYLVGGYRWAYCFKYRQVFLLSFFVFWWKPHAPRPGHRRDMGLEANADARNNPHTLKGVNPSTPKKQIAQWRKSGSAKRMFFWDQGFLLGRRVQTWGGEKGGTWLIQ